MDGNRMVCAVFLVYTVQLKAAKDVIEVGRFTWGKQEGAIPTGSGIRIEMVANIM
jgi:hypothetical protein